MALLLLLFLPSLSSPLSIVHYASTVAGSHLSFANQLTSTLVDNGHTVDLIQARVNALVRDAESRARHSVVVQFPGNRSPWNENAGHLNDPFQDSSSWNPFRNTVFNTYSSVMEQLCPLILDSDEVNDLLSSSKYDLAIVTGYDFCPLGLMHKYGIPVTAYSPTPLFLFQIVHSGTPQLPLFENAVIDSPARVDRKRFVDRLFELTRTGVEIWRHEGNIERTTTLFRSRYGPSFPDARELGRRVSFDFVNTIPLLDEPRPITPRIKYIGGIGFPKPRPLSAEIEEILKSAKRGNVIFSFGTQVPSHLINTNIVHNFVAAFKHFPEYNFIWKLDSRTQFNATNVFALDWLPQTDLLFNSRVVAFISHMGLNSFVESSLAGVPLVTIPLMVDQFHNARQAIRLGTGVGLDKRELKERKIVEALEKVLLDKSYKERAENLKRKLEENPEKSERTLIESIEFAAKYPDLHSHFTLVSTHFSWMAAHGFDLVLFLSVLSTTLFIGSLYLSISILSKLFSIRKLKSD